MPRVKKLARLERHPPMVRGYLDGYVDAVVARRGADPRGLVGSATFRARGLLDVSVYVDRPSRRFPPLRVVLEYLEGRIPSPMPAAVYFEAEAIIYWCEICLTPGSPAAVRAAFRAAVEEAAALVGAPPAEVHRIGRWR